MTTDIITLLLALSLFTFPMNNPDYPKMWKEIEVLERDGLFQSALEKVKEIEKLALENRSEDQAFKCILYKAKFSGLLSENDHEQVSTQLEEALNGDVNTLHRSILHSYLGDVYKSKSLQRANVLERQKMTEKADFHFAEAVAFFEQCDIPAKDYPSLVKMPEHEKMERYTVADILVLKSLEHFHTQFVNNRTALPEYFYLPPKQFVVFEENRDTSQLFTLLNKYETFLLDNSRKVRLAEQFLWRLERGKRPYSKDVIESINQYSSNSNDQIKARFLSSFPGQIKNAYRELKRLYTLALPKYEEQLVHNGLKHFERPSLGLQTEQCYTSKAPVIIKADFYQIKEMEVQVYNLTPRKYLEFNHSREWGKGKFGQPVYQKKMDIGAIENAQWVLPDLGLGQYVMRIQSTAEDTLVLNPDVADHYSFFQVSDIALVQYDRKLYSLNAITGSPEEGVKLEYLKRGLRVFSDFQVSKILESDESGSVSLKGDPNSRHNNHWIIASKNEDVYVNIYAQRDYYRNNYLERPMAKIYTDRAIYHPGDSVYFKGLILSKDHKTNISRPNYAYRDVEMILYNQQHQVVFRTNLKTDEYAAVHSTFKLPKNLLLGQMRIVLQIKNQNLRLGQTSIRVEEYKAPNYQIKLELESRDEEKIKVEGECMALAGYAVDQAEVEYEVYLNPIRWWYYGAYRGIPDPASEKLITSGKTTTNEEGKFWIDWAITEIDHHYRAYEYLVKVKVIDQNGEVLDERLTIPFDQSLIKVEWSGLEPLMNMEDLGDIDLKILNYNSEEISRKVNWNLERYEDLPSDKVELKWERDSNSVLIGEQADIQRARAFYLLMDEAKELKNVRSGSLQESETKLDISRWINKAGKYKISLEIEGQEFEYVFDVQSVQKGASPSNERLVFSIDKSELDLGEQIAIQLNNKGPETIPVFYAIYQNQTLLKERWLSVNSLRELEIPFEEQYRGNIEVIISYTLNGRTYHHSKLITVPFSNKKLNVEILSWPDKSDLNSNQEILLRLTDHLGNPVQSQLAISIYNKSLDDIINHNWNSDYYPSYRNRMSYRSSREDYAIARGGYTEFENTDHYYFDHPRLEAIFTHQHYYHMADGINIRGSRDLGNVPRMMNKEVAFSSEVMPEAEALDENIEAANESAPTESKVRKNLNDHMFFNGRLVSDRNGVVRIPFKTNDEISTWSVLLHAHTHDLKYFLDKREFKTFKNLLLEINAPRFFHEGDMIKLSSKGINLSEKELDLTCGARYFDDINNEWVELDMIGPKNLTIKPEESASFTTELKVPSGMDQLRIQFYANSEDFSDVVERVIPIRKNEVGLVASAPIASFNRETIWDRNSLLELINNSKYQIEKISFEYSSNEKIPILIALANVFDQRETTSPDVFNKWFSMMMVEFMVRENADLVQVYKTMRDKKVPINPLSDLNEFRIIETANTTWAKEGGTHTEDYLNAKLYENLDLLMNSSIRQAEISRLWNKLQQFVNGDGGIKWTVNSRRSSLRTTLIILEYLTRLSRQNMVDADAQFIRRSTMFAGQTLKEYLAKHGDFVQLYRNEIVAYALIIDSQKDRPYYSDFWNPETEIETIKKDFMRLSNGMQARLAILLQSKGEAQAERIIQSLKERSVYDGGVGRFWNSKSNGWEWSEWKMSNHSFIMELFQNTGEDRRWLMEMKQWLISHKQGNSWKSPQVTGDAIFSLLLGSNAGFSEPGTIRTSGREVSNDIPYVFLSDLSKEEIASLEIDSGDFGYGAVLVKYKAASQDVEKGSEELPLSLGVRYEKISKNKIEALENNEVQRGDKIRVLMTLDVDRPMDYIAIKHRRFSGGEPTEQLSQYSWYPISHYSANYADHQAIFIEHLSRGTHQLQYEFYVEQTGTLSSGISEIQSVYAPEFVNNTGNTVFTIGKN